MYLLKNAILSTNTKIQGSKQVLLFIQHLKKTKNVEEAILNTYQGKTPSRTTKARLIERTNDFVSKSVLWYTKSGSEYRKVFKNAYRALAVFKILRAISLKRDAIYIAEKNLPKAIQYQITEVVMLLVIELRNHYASVEGDKKYKQYKELCKKAIADFQAEQEAEEYFCELVRYFSRINDWYYCWFC